MSLAITENGGSNPVHGVGEACNWNLAHLHDPPYSALHQGDDLLLCGNGRDGHSIATSVISSCDCNVFTVKGPTETGDIYSKSNHEALAQSVSTAMTAYSLHSDPDQPCDDIGDGSVAVVASAAKYVDFVCSDGYDKGNVGFRMTLCQVLGMLRTLRVGGCFVMKVFSFHQVCAMWYVVCMTNLVILALYPICAHTELTCF